MRDIEQYAHVLLFACSRCGLPLTAACLSNKKNLEIAEANSFKPTCHCGWSGEIAGVTALRHWVEPWPSIPPVAPGNPGTCKDATSKHNN